MHKLKLKTLIILLTTTLATVIFINIRPPVSIKKEAPFPQQLPITENNNSIEIIFVGDIMLSRHVGTKMVRAEDWTLPFENLKVFLSSADITFGNLETPFLDIGARVTEGLSFKSEPQAIEGLKTSGFDIVSTANNHAFDRGVAGIEFTNHWLEKNKIKSVGSGTTTEETFSSEIIEINNAKIAFLAYTYFKRAPYVANLDVENLKLEIGNLKSETDFIVVSMHAGDEYTHMPNQEQIYFARAAIDLGANIVIGHHPHWVQPVEIYNEKPIFYSLGNFVFDQEWSQKTKEGLVIKIQISNNKLQEIELVPIIIENYCCPRLANQDESKKILNYIKASSTVKFK